jgi:undecaprenyl-phosphate galactose phosphotransferase
VDLASLDEPEDATSWLEVLKAHEVGFVVVALGNGDGAKERAVVSALSRARVLFALVPTFDGLPVLGFSQQYFFSHDIMLLVCRNNLARPFSRLLKMVFDQIVAAVLLVLLSPLFLVIASLVRADGGPAFFGHRRIGLNGDRFRCLKFRTMVSDADNVLRQLLIKDPAARAEWEATQKLRNDPRITAIGRFLRKTSLDELPQLLNVLRGEMSLVGPRPIVDAELPRYGKDIVYYYETRPGMTGLWQVSGRSDASYERRVQLDLWYVKNWTLWHDVTILLKTIPAVLCRDGAV